MIAAASFLSRLCTWLLPMLVGFIPLVMWQRDQERAKGADRSDSGRL